MNAGKVLAKLDFSLTKEKEKELKIKSNEFVKKLKSELSKKRIAAEVFVGGSFGKGTMIQEENYDIDVFVRMVKKRENISGEIEKVVGKKAEKIHGSRDYFKIQDGELTFEVVPVLKIKRIQDCENVTDLSYFHVGYVRRNSSDKIRREISLAKKFCKAQGFYGAESYIQGFSGYGLECLMIYYKSFEKMLRDLVKVKDEKKIIDMKKFYKNKNEIFLRINEAKLQSPVVLVDPTWKDRNVLAALSFETFKKFQQCARDFLRNPSERFFYKKDFDSAELMKSKGEFVKILLETDRQEGDIAGTKMKKFSRYLEQEIGNYFDVVGKEFIYLGGKTGEFYISAKSRKELIKQGPEKKDLKHAKRFKAKNKKVFEKNGRFFASEKVDFTLFEFLSKLKKKDFRNMGIVSFTIAKN